MKALLFPGQGSQSVGMGSDLFKNFDLIKKIFKDADQKLNYSISKIILEGPESELKLTENTQPAILLVSYSIFRLMKEEFNININESFKYFAGHSLGEYSALVASGSLRFEDALTLLHARGKSMQEAVPQGKGSMLAVMGVKIDELNKLIDEADRESGICEIANDNSYSQIILSGDKKAVNNVNEILKQNKKKNYFFTCECTISLFFNETSCR